MTGLSGSAGKREFIGFATLYDLSRARSDFVAFDRIVLYIFAHFKTNLMKSRQKELIAIAGSAKRRAYAPYSRFRVGAAIEATSGKVYSGCNIENSSYGLTICAERTAIFKAISESERNFRAIAIVADDSDFTPPCGACRQVLFDLAGNIEIIMVNSAGRIKTTKLKDLLPMAFDSKHLRWGKKSKK